MENFINSLLTIIVTVALVKSVTLSKLKISTKISIFILSYLSLGLIKVGYSLIKMSSIGPNPILIILCGIAIIIIAILVQTLNYISNIKQFSFNNKVLYFTSFTSLIPICLFLLI